MSPPVAAGHVVQWYCGLVRSRRQSRFSTTSSNRVSAAHTPRDLDLLWFCQLAADGEFIGSGPMRRPSLPYLASLVETAAEMGFTSLLTATNFHAENDAWTASVATLARTRGAGLLVAVRPGMFHPAIFAKMAATAATLFPGRLQLNVVTGSNPAENAMYGDFDSHDARHARTHEWVSLVRRLWTEPAVDHEGTFYACRGAVLAPEAGSVDSHLRGRPQRGRAAARGGAGRRVPGVGRHARRHRRTAVHHA